MGHYTRQRVAPQPITRARGAAPHLAISIATPIDLVNIRRDNTLPTSRVGDDVGLRIAFLRPAASTRVCDVMECDTRRRESLGRLSASPQMCPALVAPPGARVRKVGQRARTQIVSAPRSQTYQSTSYSGTAVDRPTVLEPVFVGTSAALNSAIRYAVKLAPFDHAPVLIEGESGTGKSYLAQLLHLRSPRARAPLHRVMLSALDDSLASSDLFGHLSGAYTDARQNRPGHFVSANGGTLFLDEVGKASPSVQRKLLHAVEHGEVWPVGADRSVRLDVRLVAATNIPLSELVQQGQFLPDLAARLTGFRVRLPALRERREDIPDLVRQFVAVRAPAYGYGQLIPTVSAPLLRLLQGAEWPNNLRQLDSVVQRLLIEAAGDQELTMEHCRADLAFLGDETAQSPRDKVAITPQIVSERLTILGSVTATARSLGVSRWTIYRYLERARSTSQHAV
jgi:DNA-binding NtrC family response regulator